MTKKLVTVDTNALIENPSILFDLQDEYKIIISGVTIRELDKFKNDFNERGFKARQAYRNIKQLITENNIVIDYDGLDNSNDDEILRTCINYKADMLTNDIILQLKSRGKNINLVDFTKNETEDKYTGIRETWIAEKEYVDLMESTYLNSYNLYPNEYLIIHNTTTNKDCLVVWNGEYFEHVTIKPIKSRYAEVKPLDIYQKAFIHMLQNDKAIIKATNSPYGAGKSYLMLHWALQMIDKVKFNRLYFVKADNPPSGRKPFPAVPGDVNEKSEALMGIIKDSTGERDFTDMLLRNDRLEILPIQFAKGRSLSKSILLINEAQDFTPSEMEKLLSRLGEDSVALIDGSDKQIDNPFCLGRSGLDAVIENFKEDDIAAQVNLVNDYRGKISKLVSQKNWRNY